MLTQDKLFRLSALNDAKSVSSVSLAASGIHTSLPVKVAIYKT